MTRPDANWRRSTVQCVRLSVPISGWSQKSYVLSVPVCLSQDWFSNAVSSVVLFIVYFESAVYAECLSVAWTFIDVWSIIWSAHVNHLKYICEVISSWKRSLIGSHRRKKGNLGHVVWLFRSLRTSLCRVTEYIVCYTPLKGPLSVRPTSQSTRTLTSAWSAWSTFIVSTWSWLAVYLSVT